MKAEIFKKGQLIPKRLGVLQIHKKARHYITFGADVEVWKENGITVVKTLSSGCVIYARAYPKRKRNNGTFQKVSSVIQNIHTIGEVGIRVDGVSK